MFILLAKVVIATVSAKMVMDAFNDVAPSPGQPFQEDGENVLQEITDRLDIKVREGQDDRDNSDGELPVQDASGAEVGEAIKVQGEESAGDANAGELEQVEAVVVVQSNSGNGGGQEGGNEATKSFQAMEGSAPVTFVTPAQQERSDHRGSEVTEAPERREESSERGDAGPSSTQPPHHLPTPRRRTRRRPRRRSRWRLTSAWVLLRRPRAYFGLPDYDTEEEKQRRMREAREAANTRNQRILRWLGGGSYY